ncbi:MAG: isoamylase early set domain-containing protein [Bacteroidales bacterium]|nr:isoamylase early set domain-containing protein [Bacteroidales bacterium]
MNKKEYLKSKPECKVTFRLPKEIVAEAETVNLVGDFNNWDANSTPMKKLKSGEFTVTVTLQKDNEYQYRYFIDGKIWKNEENADKYLMNEFGSENSVVVV